MASMSDVIGFKKDFQKQVASIMEMLSKTAVAEMCKLFEDGYSCLHLGMEQERQRIKREYNSLKEELQMMKQSVAQRNNNGGTASTENGEVLGMPMCTCQCSQPLAENQVNSPFQGAVLMACYEFPEVKQEPPDICQDNILEMGMLLTSETTAALKSESEFETSFPSGGPTPDAEDSSCLDATDPSSQSTQSSDTLDSKSISASMPPRRTRLKRRLGPNKEPYPCHLCRKTFSQYTSLEAHMRVHTGEKPYKCDECGKRFSQIGNLNMHLKIHTGERQFSCTVCGKKFMTLGNLNSHIQTHRSGKAVTRGRKGRPKIGRQHQAKPEGGDARTKLFPCQRCGKLFARANLLRKHQENQCQ